MVHPVVRDIVTVVYMAIDLVTAYNGEYLRRPGWTTGEY